MQLKTLEFYDDPYSLELNAGKRISSENGIIQDAQGFRIDER
jgi:hypothetical protein